MKLRNKKTGEIGQIGYVATQDGQIIVEDISGQEYPYSVICSYDTLEELNKEWEDYKPKEPLIKDEKIRKAVRAWADVNSIKEVQYCERANRSLCILTDMGNYDFSIEFVGWIPTLKDDEVHTIAELCGEEEECGN